MNYDDMIPTQDENYLFNLDVLNYQFNELFIYVEDRFKEEFYWNITQSFIGEFKFDNIFGLGGKDNVIAKAESNINNKNCIHIVDKDFDDILECIQTYENLFYLEKYCIENYLVEPMALIKFLVFQRPTRNRNTINIEIDLPNIIKESENELCELMILFIAIQKYINPTIAEKRFNEGSSIRAIKTCKLKLRLFQDNDYDTVISQSKINKFILETETYLSSFDCSFNLRNSMTLVCNSLGITDYSQLSKNHIHGKYLLKLISIHLKNKFTDTRNINEGQITQYLSQTCNFTNLINTKNQILSYLEQ